MRTFKAGGGHNGVTCATQAVCYASLLAIRAWLAPCLSPGGGLLADRLGRHGRRWWVTGLATCLAAPFLAASCLAPSPQLSYAAVLVGFALSEMWRAPSAVMARWGRGEGAGPGRTVVGER